MKRLSFGIDEEDPGTWAPNSSILYLRNQLQAAAAAENVEPQILDNTVVERAAEQVAQDIDLDLQGDCNVYCNLANQGGWLSPTPQEQALRDLETLGKQGSNPANVLALSLSQAYQSQLKFSKNLTGTIGWIALAFNQHASASGQDPSQTGDKPVIPGAVKQIAEVAIVLYAGANAIQADTWGSRLLWAALGLSGLVAVDKVL